MREEAAWGVASGDAQEVTEDLSKESRVRKTILGVASAFMLLAGAVPAHANVVIDPVFGPVTGGCFSEFAGTGSSMNIIVEAAVAAPAGAVSLSVTCHVTQQTWWGTRDGHVGAVGVAGVAAGGGVLTGWDLGSYDLCTEIHASFLTGPPYHKDCH
jgi:hypothetical protein